MKLDIGDGLKLPLEAVTQTFCILAKRGVGKSYTASVMAEEMLSANQQIIALDPTGAWWGLRSKFPVVVFGGEHGDLPLEDSAGETVAHAIVEGRFPAVIDLSLFSKGKSIRFMVAFAETLYRINREAVHLFVDEADAFAPQGRSGFGVDESRLLGAMEDVVRRGRKRGIGCTLITQRPQVLNKNVLTQCEVLIAMRLMHPKDIDAIEEWVNVHGDPATAKKMIDSLPSLPVGEAWFWAPAWGDIFRRVKVRQRMTFDSGATPKPGEREKAPPKLAAVDLEKLGERIKAAAESAKANDPKALKAEIAKLRKELASKPPTVAPIAVEKVIEKPVLKDGQLARAEKLVERMQSLMNDAREVYVPLADAVSKTLVQPKPVPQISPRKFVNPRVIIPKPSTNGHVSGDIVLTGKQQQILDALAWYESLGNLNPTLTQVGAVALIDASGGYFSNVVGPLSNVGYVERGAGTLRLTDAGREIAKHPDSVGTLDEYHDVLRARVRKMKSAGGKTIDILNTLIAAGGEALTIEQIGEAVGVDSGGGYFSNCIGPLSTAGLIERERGTVRATEVLFPRGLP